MTGRPEASGMVKRYIAALLLIPLADALLLVLVADVLGWPPTVLLVVLTGLVGMLLVRAEGRTTLRRLQEKVTTGQLPTDELLDAGLLVAAGAFLLTPGLVTDGLGFLFVFPPTRYPIRGLVKRVARPYVDRKSGGLISGEIYTGGFPTAGTDAGPTHDLDEDAYDVGFDDEEEFEGEEA
jgi:UPF0716 protein FxsA